MLGGRLIDPTIDDQLIVNPEAKPVIRRDVKSVASGKFRDKLADPPDRKIIRKDAGSRRSGPREIDVRVIAREDRRIRQAGVVEVGPHEALKNGLRMAVRENRRDLRLRFRPTQQMKGAKNGQWRMTNDQ